MTFSTKIIFLAALVAFLGHPSEAGVLDFMWPKIIDEFYQFVPFKEGFRYILDLPNGAKREEIGFIMNPGTPEEELVVMGTYSTVDEFTGDESITVYRADKNGYKAMSEFKNRKVGVKCLKSCGLG